MQSAMTSLTKSTTISSQWRTRCSATRRGLQLQQQQQQQPVQGDIVAATVAAMHAANGQAGPKKIDYHLKPKILGK
jgi:hypothetical protein